MKGAYKLPKSKADKVRLLTDISAGRKTINAIKDKPWTTYFMQDDGNYNNRNKYDKGGEGEVFTLEDIHKRREHENIILVTYGDRHEETKKAPLTRDDHYNITLDLNK